MQYWYFYFLVIPFINGCYILSQASHQGRLLKSAKLIDIVIDQDSTPMSVRKKLLHVKEVIAFAKKQGLNTEGAYQKYVDNKYNAVSFTVHAAKEFELKPKTWWFPVVGTVPYLGFFEPKDANKKILELKNQGYDVYRGEVAGFSSLGWFNDPIYRSMLKRKDISLAHLMFHELTHRTAWISGKVKLNETLAEFVAKVLVRRYYKVHEIIDYEKSLKKRVLFKRWLRKLKQNLKMLYKNDSITLSRKRELKKSTISKFLSLKDKGFKVGSHDWNNAKITSISLYEADESCFQGVFQKTHKNLELFFNKIEDGACHNL